MRCPAPVIPALSSRRSSLRSLLPAAPHRNPIISFISNTLSLRGVDDPNGLDIELQDTYTPAKERPPIRKLRIVTIIACIVGTTYLVLAYLLSWTADHHFPLDPSLYTDPTFHSNDHEVIRTVSFENDPTHVLVSQDLHPPEPLLRPLQNRLPHYILSSYYSTGSIPLTAPQVPTPPVDIVYLWVNASGPIFQTSLRERSKEEGLIVKEGDLKRYRDNAELRGAIRSAVSSLNGLHKVHVISGDYDLDEKHHRELLATLGDAIPEDLEGSWKIGQIPEWLNWTSTRDQGSTVNWHFHSSVFRLPRDHDEQMKRTREEMEWRSQALPNFNSFAIESRAGWIQGLSENFILANDDMFMLAPMSPTDFHHPLLGDVIRLDGNFLVKPHVTPDLYSTPGEWGGLQYASQLISARFPTKSRGYLYHIPKATTVHLMHEASIVWEKELTEAATRGFRRSKRGLADIEMSWLITYLRIERWREALLWTWAVARMGGENGLWGANARDELRKLLGIKQGVGDQDEVMVRRGERRTLQELGRAEHRMGWEAPKSTKYIFSSMDGHLGQNPGTDEGATCILSLSACLPENFFVEPYQAVSASDMFINLAFADPRCGDCLITALITASGPVGLSAILPEDNQVYYPPASPRKKWDRSEPILPLTSIWQEASFALEDVVEQAQDQWDGSPQAGGGGVNVRQWCIKLLSRYAYVFGNTKSRFAQVYEPVDLTNALDSYDTDRSVAMVCVNDDQPDNSPGGSRAVFEAWMEERWGDVDATWERKKV